MVRASRSGIGRAVQAVVVIVVVVVAFGVGFALNSRATSSSATSSTTSTSSSTSPTTSSTTSSTTTTQTSSTSTTLSSTSTVTGCVFAPPPPLVVANSTVPPIFTGCLTPGATGMYLLAIKDPDNIIVQGVVRTQYSANISVIGAPVLNYTAAGNGGVAEASYNSTVLPMPDLQLIHDRGYAFTIVNLSGQNNTVTINLLLTDAVTFLGA